MSLFKKFESSQTIFKNESIFSPDFLPTEVLHREKEINEIAFNLALVIKGKRAPSIILYGSPGTGKTTVVKYVIGELKEASTRVHSIYLNCAEEGYRYAILGKIAFSLGYAVSRRGRSADELLEYIVEIIKKENKTLAVVLDDVDMLSSEEKNGILYDLLRMRENFNVDCVVIAITNREDFFSKLENRIRSSILQAALKFEQYSPLQLKDILRERVKLGLIPNTCDENVIGLCAGFAAKNGGDARLGINVLWLAAKEADRNSSAKITLTHVEKVKKDAQMLLRNEHECALSKEEKIVLAEIRNAKKIQSGELYSKLGFNERSIRNYLAKLEDLGFIESIRIYSNSTLQN